MGVERVLATIPAVDGEVHDALLHIDERPTRVRERATGRRTALIHVHGIMGNFLVGTLRFLPAHLARAGFPTLVVETRMGNVGQLFGKAIFEDAVKDIAAAWGWLQTEGYDSVVVCGYSSGATLAARYVATHPLHAIRGLVSISGPWGLPESLEERSRTWGAEPSYEEIVARLGEVVGEGTPDSPADDRLFVIEQSRGPTRRPRDSEVYTYRTWWHSRGPEAHAAQAYRQLPHVTVPTLFTQGDADDVVLPEEAERQAALMREAGNDRVHVARIPGATHFYKGQEILLIDAITAFLREIT
jgi:pimeloyl-ACP methyl ester carboxylesterase